MRAVYLRAARRLVQSAKRYEEAVLHSPYDGNRRYAMRQWEHMRRVARFAARKAGVRVAYLED